MTRRLDDLAATVARLNPATPGPAAPPGEPLDEATRAGLDHLLATLEESGIDRVIENPARAAEVLAAVEATRAIRRAPRS